MKGEEGGSRETKGRSSGLTSVDEICCDAGQVVVNHGLKFLSCSSLVAEGIYSHVLSSLIQILHRQALLEQEMVVVGCSRCDKHNVGYAPVCVVACGAQRSEVGKWPFWCKLN